ncbi:MAG TPA: hypothetical protein VIM87_09095 [Chitinophaga sp.]|uniref:hypothetical protein n=1 Tax=Chitinophaga sp. TaxID=1869181 RepID=UPI002F947EF9
MEIYISEDATIATLQHEFREAYPYLKLECYRQPHSEGQACAVADKLPPATPIEEIRMMHNFGWLDISHHRTAAAVELDFFRKYGLSVQILRKSGDLWLQTTATDNWTLGQMNEEGKLAEKNIFYYPEEPVG